MHVVLVVVIVVVVLIVSIIATYAVIVVVLSVHVSFYPYYYYAVTVGVMKGDIVTFDFDTCFLGFFQYFTFNILITFLLLVLINLLIL